MKITPLDIQHQVFKTTFRGYDTRQVNQFLGEVAETVEVLTRDNALLREKLASQEQELSQLRKAEASLTNTLISTQNFADQLTKGAQQEADRMIKEAELRSEELLLNGRTQLIDLQRSLADLHRQRVMAIEKFRATLKAFEAILTVEEGDVAPIQSSGEKEQDNRSSSGLQRAYVPSSGQGLPERWNDPESVSRG